MEEENVPRMQVEDETLPNDVEASCASHVTKSNLVVVQEMDCPAQVPGGSHENETPDIIDTDLSKRELSVDNVSNTGYDREENKDHKPIIMYRLYGFLSQVSHDGPQLYDESDECGSPPKLLHDNINNSQLEVISEDRDSLPKLSHDNINNSQLNVTSEDCDSLPKLSHDNINNSQLNVTSEDCESLPKLSHDNINNSQLKGTSEKRDSLPKLSLLSDDNSQLEVTSEDCDLPPKLSHDTSQLEVTYSEDCDSPPKLSHDNSQLEVTSEDCDLPPKLSHDNINNSQLEVTSSEEYGSPPKLLPKDVLLEAVPECSSPPEECSSPPEECSSPPEECSSPPEECSSPPEECKSPPEECSSPPEECSSPPEECSSPPEECSSPPKECSSLPEECKSPPEECKSPLEHFVTTLGACERIVGENCLDKEVDDVMENYLGKVATTSSSNETFQTDSLEDNIEQDLHKCSRNYSEKITGGKEKDESVRDCLEPVVLLVNIAMKTDHTYCVETRENSSKESSSIKCLQNCPKECDKLALEKDEIMEIIPTPKMLARNLEGSPTSLEKSKNENVVPDGDVCSSSTNDESVVRKTKILRSSRRHEENARIKRLMQGARDVLGIFQCMPAPSEFSLPPEIGHHRSQHRSSSSFLNAETDESDDSDGATLGRPGSGRSLERTEMRTLRSGKIVAGEHPNEKYPQKSSPALDARLNNIHGLGQLGRKSTKERRAKRIARLKCTSARRALVNNINGLCRESVRLTERKAQQRGLLFKKKRRQYKCQPSAKLKDGDVSDVSQCENAVEMHVGGQTAMAVTFGTAEETVSMKSSATLVGQWDRPDDCGVSAKRIKRDDETSTANLLSPSRHSVLRNREAIEKTPIRLQPKRSSRMQRKAKDILFDRTEKSGEIRDIAETSKLTTSNIAGDGDSHFIPPQSMQYSNVQNCMVSGKGPNETLANQGTDKYQYVKKRPVSSAQLKHLEKMWKRREIVMGRKKKKKKPDCEKTDSMTDDRRKLEESDRKRRKTTVVEEGVESVVEAIDHTMELRKILDYHKALDHLHDVHNYSGNSRPTPFPSRKWTFQNSPQGSTSKDQAICQNLRESSVFPLSEERRGRVSFVPCPASATSPGSEDGCETDSAESFGALDGSRAGSPEIEIDIDLGAAVDSDREDDANSEPREMVNHLNWNNPREPTETRSTSETSSGSMQARKLPIFQRKLPNPSSVPVASFHYNSEATMLRRCSKSHPCCRMSAAAHSVSKADNSTQWEEPHMLNKYFSPDSKIYKWGNSKEAFSVIVPTIYKPNICEKSKSKKESKKSKSRRAAERKSMLAQTDVSVHDVPSSGESESITVCPATSSDSIWNGVLPPSYGNVTHTFVRAAHATSSTSSPGQILSNVGPPPPYEYANVCPATAATTIRTVAPPSCGNISLVTLRTHATSTNSSIQNMVYPVTPTSSTGTIQSAFTSASRPTGNLQYAFTAASTSTSRPTGNIQPTITAASTSTSRPTGNIQPTFTATSSSRPTGNIQPTFGVEQPPANVDTSAGTGGTQALKLFSAKMLASGIAALSPDATPVSGKGISVLTNSNGLVQTSKPVTSRIGFLPCIKANGPVLKSLPHHMVGDQSNSSMTFLPSSSRSDGSSSALQGYLKVKNSDGSPNSFFYLPVVIQGKR